MALSIAVTAWIVVRRSKVCSPRPPASRSPNARCTACSTCRREATDWPITRLCASSVVWRIFSPPGTSPTPVRPALSVRISRLRVKNGPCAPLRLSSIESRPATGITRIATMRGVDAAVMRLDSVGRDLTCLDELFPARVLALLICGELLRRIGHDLEAQVGELLLDIGIAQRGRDAFMHLAAHLGRQALRCDDALPGVHIHALDTGLGQRGHIGQQRRALLARDCER